jgi:hypothetical protein
MRVAESTTNKLSTKEKGEKKKGKEKEKAETHCDSLICIDIFIDAMRETFHVNNKAI